MDLIPQGAEHCSTLAMQTPSQWKENIMSLHDMDSLPDERPLSCQNCTPTQYSPFSEQTVIPKLAFQASGCLTQSRCFATPPSPAVPWLWCYRNCCLHQATDKLLKTHEMITRPATSVNECSVVSIHLFPKCSRSESWLWWVQGALTIPANATVSGLPWDHKITWIFQKCHRTTVLPSHVRPTVTTP